MTVLWLALGFLLGAGLIVIWAGWNDWFGPYRQPRDVFRGGFRQR
jgi:4-amino-4-deoxy-L-arabinose transferase-like glycosyltransferase